MFSNIAYNVLLLWLFVSVFFYNFNNMSIAELIKGRFHHHQQQHNNKIDHMLILRKRPNSTIIALYRLIGYVDLKLNLDIFKIIFF